MPFSQIGELPEKRPGPLDKHLSEHYTRGMGQYIREDRRKGRIYYWLVESHREGKKVVQKRLKYLGAKPPTPEELARLNEEFKTECRPSRETGGEGKGREGK